MVSDAIKSGGTMKNDAQATDDSVRLSTLQAIQTLQQDQLNVLEILGKLIHGMEALDQRLRKLEDDHARANGLEELARR
jgi:hypothetical protein